MPVISAGPAAVPTVWTKYGLLNVKLLVDEFVDCAWGGYLNVVHYLVAI